MSSYRAKIFLETMRESGIEEIFLPLTAQRKSEKVSGEKKELLELREKVVHCTKCDELVQNRHSVVFGSGNPNAELVFVGEAPGAEESAGSEVTGGSGVDMRREMRENWTAVYHGST